MIKIVLATGLLAFGHAFYSNQQASQCIENKGLSQCGSFKEECQKSQSCKDQLLNLGACSIDGHPYHIYNGNCYKKWLENSQETRSYINCLNQNCNLTYNSLVAPNELFRCVQSTVMENFHDCGSKCMKQLGSMRSKFTQLTIQDLFKIPIEDSKAKHLVNLVKINCLKMEPKDILDEEQKNQGDQKQQL